MFPAINIKETGINFRRIMDKRGISAKDIQEYLNLASVQSVYNWCKGINMPTIDNLYALSQLFQLPIKNLKSVQNSTLTVMTLSIAYIVRD